MARLNQGPIAPSHSRRPSNPESSRADLTRLLARLQQTVLHADPDREVRLRASEHERSKAGVNLEYARSLLTRLEHDAATNVKVHVRRADIQADLNRKRDLIDQLAERLRELDDTSFDSDEDDDDEDDDGAEDLLAGIVQPAGAPRPPQAQSRGQLPGSRGAANEAADDGMDAWGVEDDDGEEEDDEPTVLPASRRQTAIRSPVADPAETQPPPEATKVPAPTSTSQELRLRQTATSPGSSQQPAPTEASSTATARAELLGTRRRRQTAGGGDDEDATRTTATTEAILDNHRAEQDRLTASLVSMATALKKSSQAFATSLEGGKGTVDAAAEGLQRNETGLDAAARRMGRLRRAAEGRGWLGRIYLYAYIGALSVFALLLVFVLPKLRF